MASVLSPSNVPSGRGAPPGTETTRPSSAERRPRLGTNRRPARPGWSEYRMVPSDRHSFTPTTGNWTPSIREATSPSNLSYPGWPGDTGRSRSNSLRAGAITEWVTNSACSSEALSIRSLMVAASTHHSTTPTATNAANVVRANRGTRVRLGGLSIVLRESAPTEVDLTTARARRRWEVASRGGGVLENHS